jgi:hypothetical protein
MAADENLTLMASAVAIGTIIASLNYHGLLHSSCVVSLTLPECKVVDGSDLQPVAFLGWVVVDRSYELGAKWNAYLAYMPVPSSC